jgi:DinB superfamily
MPIAVQRPRTDEHIAYYSKYIDPIEGDDAVPSLSARYAPLLALLRPLDEAKALYRYAPGKWSIKESLTHITDVERVMSYRALRIGRADETPLPGFDENVYVPNSRAEDRPLADLCAELLAVRESTLTLLGSFDAAALVRRGTSNAGPISVRALLWIIAGHERHHTRILADRYGLAASHLGGATR